MKKSLSTNNSTAFTYMLLCSDDTIYTGWTNDLQKRLTAHNTKKGAKYTKYRTPVKLVYFEEFSSKSEAMKREYQLKQLNKKEKSKLISEFQNLNK